MVGTQARSPAAISSSSSSSWEVNPMSKIEREVLDQDVVYDQAELGRNQLLLFGDHIRARLQRRDGRRIGARTTDSLLFQRFHQRRFGIAGRRLREVLLRQQRLEIERLAAFDRGQRPGIELVGIAVIAAGGIGRHEAGKPDHGASGAEDERRLGRSGELRLGTGGDIDRRAVEHRRRHLARHEALPNKLVQPKLLRRE